MTPEAWLAKHPYLQPVAEFHAQVEQAVADLPCAFACIPNWQDYEDSFRVGVPLLRSSTLAIDPSPVGIIVKSLTEILYSRILPDKLTQDLRALHAEMHEDVLASQRAVARLLDPDASAPIDSGLLRYLCWTVIARHLSRVVDAFGKWRDEERWLHRYCPTCGSLPAMAQLVGIDPGRQRFLSCGCCGTRWQYRRTECPFCEIAEGLRLFTLRVEGEECLRIDYCESCRGYIKTYNGTGSESVLLADWTSLHLDVIARDHGLNQSAVSLYQL